MMKDATKAYVVAVVALALMGGTFFLYTRTARIGGSGQTAQAVEQETRRNENYVATFEYPTGNGVGAAEVASFVKNEVNAFEALADEDVPRLRSEVGFRYQYTIDVVVDIYQSATYRSYVVTTGEYTGGANANATVESFVYDEASGERVALADILPPGDADAFVEAVKEALRMRSDQVGVFSDAVDALTLASLTHFYVTDTGVVVLFSKYEVAPGAAGIVSVEVSV